MADDEKKDAPPAPKLPMQAAIYISPEGEVTFGALFEEFLGVARALDPDAQPACEIPARPDAGAPKVKDPTGKP